jgi:hypothetical protein
VKSSPNKTDHTNIQVKEEDAPNAIGIKLLQKEAYLWSSFRVVPFLYKINYPKIQCKTISSCNLLCDKK